MRGVSGLLDMDSFGHKRSLQPSEGTPLAGLDSTRNSIVGRMSRGQLKVDRIGLR